LSDAGCGRLSAATATELLGTEVTASTAERGSGTLCVYSLGDGKNFEVSIVSAAVVRPMANSIGTPPFDHYSYVADVNDFMAFSELNHQAVTISGEEGALISDRGANLDLESMTKLCEAVFG
jgi:hypothetical protein